MDQFNLLKNLGMIVMYVLDLEKYLIISQSRKLKKEKPGSKVRRKQKQRKIRKIRNRLKLNKKLLNL